MDELRHAYQIVRNFLLRLFSRQFLIFLFFLCLSGIFWLSMTLNETFEKEFTVEVRLADLPRNVVITSDSAINVRVTIRDKGYTMAGYIYGDRLRPIFVNFKTYNDNSGRISIPLADIQRLISQKIYKSSKITSIKSDNTSFTYNFGQHKRVPVQLHGTIDPGENFYLAGVRFRPDSVTVYATKKVLDSIRVAHTERVRIVNFSSAKTVSVRLSKRYGVKCVPSEVEMTLYPDILTDAVVEVPVVAVNVPADKTLRTFPSSVNVSFSVGAQRLKTMARHGGNKALSPAGFRLEVDYNDVVKNKPERCPLYLRAIPGGVRNAHPVVDEIDYLIEQK